MKGKAPPLAAVQLRSLVRDMASACMDAAYPSRAHRDDSGHTPGGGSSSAAAFSCGVYCETRRRSAWMLPTPVERSTMVRIVAIFCVVFHHTKKRGFELSIAVASQAVQVAGGEAPIFNFLFGEALRIFSQAFCCEE